MTEYHKTIVFTKTPLTGLFRYKDFFQIYPADLKGMPKSNMQEHYPIILEYTTTEDDKIEPFSEYEILKDLKSYTATTLTKQDQILNLLTLFTNHLFFRYNDTTGTWGMPMLKDNPGEEANSWSAKWCLKLFHWPELPAQLKIESFSKTEFSKVNYIPHFTYYYHDPNFDYHSGKTITFPATIFIGLDSYYSLSKESREHINSAISHIVSAVELRYYKKTLSIIASFTAIETMVNYEFRNVKHEQCGQCGQLRFKVAQKFRDYLFKYVGKSTSNKKKFNAFYSLRSKIVHAGEQLKTEKLWNDLPKSDKHKEFLNQLEIIQLGKISIIHWLIKNR